MYICSRHIFCISYYSICHIIVSGWDDFDLGDVAQPAAAAATQPSSQELEARAEAARLAEASAAAASQYEAKIQSLEQELQAANASAAPAPAATAVPDNWDDFDLGDVAPLAAQAGPPASSPYAKALAQIKSLEQELEAAKASAAPAPGNGAAPPSGGDGGWDDLDLGDVAQPAAASATQPSSQELEEARAEAARLAEAASRYEAKIQSLEQELQASAEARRALEAAPGRRTCIQQ